MERVKSSHCEVCQAQRRFTRQTPNHALHIILTIVTAGIWLIPYIVIALTSPSHFTCVQCGSKLLSSWEKKLDEKGQGWVEKTEAWVSRVKDRTSEWNRKTTGWERQQDASWEESKAASRKSLEEGTATREARKARKTARRSKSSVASSGPASFCAKCGQRINDDWRFCRSCGTERTAQTGGTRESE